MDVPALIRRAMHSVGSQAELARRMGVSEPTVSRWLLGKGGLDYASALRLARVSGLPPHQVVAEAGHDPTLLPAQSPAEAELTPIQRDVLVRMGRVQAVLDATEGLPDNFVDVYLRKMLDNTEGEITATIRMVHQIRHAQANVINADEAEVSSVPESGANGPSERPPGKLPATLNTLSPRPCQSDDNWSRDAAVTRPAVISRSAAARVRAPTRQSQPVTAAPASDGCGRRVYPRCAR